MKLHPSRASGRFGNGIALRIPVLLGISCLLAVPSMGQQAPSLEPYGPWSSEQLSKVTAAFDLIQNARELNSDKREAAKLALAKTDIQSVVRALYCLPRGAASPSFRATAEDLLSSRLPDLITMLGGPMRDKDMVCLLLDVRWPNAKGMVGPLASAMAEGCSQAACKLKEFGPDARGALPDLTSMLLDPNSSQDAAGVMLGIGPRAMRGFALALASDSREVRLRAAMPIIVLSVELVDGANDDATKLVRRILLDPSLDAASPSNGEALAPRWMALQVLRHIAPRDERAVLAIVQALKDPNQDLSIWSTMALASLGSAGRSAVPGLVGALTDDRGEVRTASADALVALGDVARPWLPTIRGLLNGADWSKDYTAAYTLSHFGAEGVAALPRLVEGLRIGGPGVHARSIEAIGRLGEVARPYVPAIRELLISKDPEVRAAAAAALSGLEGHRF